MKRSTTGGGPYTQAGNPAAAGFTDAGLTNGTKYFYVVSAYNSYGESTNSTEVNATPAAPAAGTAPSALIATPGNAQVALNWNTVTGASTYNVKRGTSSSGPFSTISAPGSVTGTTYTDSSAVSGATYYYVVSAVNGGGESPNSTPS